MMHIHQGDFILRPLDPEDIHYLYRWLTDDCVLEFYEGRDKRFTREMIQEKYLTPSSRPIYRELVLWQGLPIGYMQIYPLSVEEYETYGYSLFEHIIGMDQFIGEVTLWNQGIGTGLIQTVCQWLEAHQEVDCLVMDPRADNLRAIHVYEKCGFRKVKYLLNHEYHEGIQHDCWLMERRHKENPFPTNS
ncbi:GNAT family N-acetyltransferase [Sulfobacillus thermosulfidooxidans]|nr:GNAT family N-acetyltransferase [Sulfobacillus thermosulfidooxidans]